MQSVRWFSISYRMRNYACTYPEGRVYILQTKMWQYYWELDSYIEWFCQIWGSYLRTNQLTTLSYTAAMRLGKIRSERTLSHRNNLWRDVLTMIDTSTVRFNVEGERVKPNFFLPEVLPKSYAKLIHESFKIEVTVEDFNALAKSVIRYFPCISSNKAKQKSRTSNALSTQLERLAARISHLCWTKFCVQAWDSFTYYCSPLNSQCSSLQNLPQNT